MHMTETGHRHKNGSALVAIRFFARPHAKNFNAFIGVKHCVKNAIIALSNPEHIGTPRHFVASRRTRIALEGSYRSVNPFKLIGIKVLCQLLQVAYGSRSDIHRILWGLAVVAHGSNSL